MQAMLKKITTAFLALATSGFAIAQEAETKEEKKTPLNITGFADIYYKYDFAKTADNNKTSFTGTHNSFALGMASVKLDKSFGKVGVVADLGFGQRAKEFSYNDEGITASIKQLYVTYAATDKLTFTAGSWATHVGYELVDAPANRNYSMSYMFSYGPFFHTGVKADYKFGNSGIMLGVSNPTDYKVTESAPKYLLGQFSTATANGKLKAYLNYVGGKSSDTTKMNQVDLVVTGAVSDKFSIGYNGTIASFKEKEADKYGDASNWWGSALYLNADFTEKFGLTLRSEIFDDKKQLNVFGGASAGGNVFANTLSAKISLGDLAIIPEFRYENASQAIFIDSKGAPTKSAANVLVAAIYSF
jgi:Putative beta-barrel porin-2, OmpL-like. bbp2